MSSFLFNADTIILERAAERNQAGYTRRILHRVFTNSEANLRGLTQLQRRAVSSRSACTSAASGVT